MSSYASEFRVTYSGTAPWEVYLQASMQYNVSRLSIHPTLFGRINDSLCRALGGCDG
jgi:hypothetical protein